MSYVVKGYEFPKSCRECWLIYPEVGDSGECIFTDKFWENEEDRPSKSRLPKCPLVEIPTPHGRLIDADALKEKIESIYGGALWTFDCFTLIDDEEIAPTIIEAEVSEE